jgi:hypothetical protein
MDLSSNYRVQYNGKYVLHTSTLVEMHVDYIAICESKMCDCIRHVLEFVWKECYLLTDHGTM